MTKFKLITTTLALLALVLNSQGADTLTNVAYFSESLVSDILQKRYAQQLQAMHEPVLSSRVGNTNYFALRVISSGHGTLEVVRCDSEGTQLYRYAARASSILDVIPGNVMFVKKAQIEEKEINKLNASLEKSGFWKLRENDDVDGFDGSWGILEVVKDGVYHAIRRYDIDFDKARRGLSGIAEIYATLFQSVGFWHTTNGTQVPVWTERRSFIAFPQETNLPVVAIYAMNWTTRPREPQLISALWADGNIIWSESPIKGGPPYRKGRFNSAKLSDCMDKWDRQGAFGKEADSGFVVPDFSLTNIEIDDGRRHAHLLSTHELLPDNPVSEKHPHFDKLWSTIREDVRGLTPAAGELYQGKITNNNSR
jgi:hypothetical protein